MPTALLAVGFAAPTMGVDHGFLISPCRTIESIIQSYPQKPWVQPEHVDASELLDRLKDSGQRISHDTLNGMLKRLRSAGVIVDLSGGSRGVPRQWARRTEP